MRLTGDVHIDTATARSLCSEQGRKRFLGGAADARDAPITATAAPVRRGRRSRSCPRAACRGVRPRQFWQSRKPGGFQPCGFEPAGRQQCRRADGHPRGGAPIPAMTRSPPRSGGVRNSRRNTRGEGQAADGSVRQGQPSSRPGRRQAPCRTCSGPTASCCLVRAEGPTQPVNDIIDMIGRKRFIPAALEGITVDGNTYTVPQSGFPFFIYYRKDIVQEARPEAAETHASCSRTSRRRTTRRISTATCSRTRPPATRST